MRILLKLDNTNSPEAISGWIKQAHTRGHELLLGVTTPQSDHAANNIVATLTQDLGLGVVELSAANQHLAIKDLGVDAIAIITDEHDTELTDTELPVFLINADKPIDLNWPPMARASNSPPITKPRPRLALLSPIPPAQSGIADYTADLLPALAEHYDITVIDTTPPELHHGVNNELDRDHVHDVTWFMQNASNFDRIVYQLGNSGFHIGILEALGKFSGVVMLHDFFLGHYVWREQVAHQSSIAFNVFHEDHGLKALALAANDLPTALHIFPANRWVFHDAKAVMVHSAYAKRLVGYWHGQAALDKTHVVHFAEPLTKSGNRDEARHRLGLATEDFVVCSFGYIDPIKLSDRIVKAWAASKLSHSPHCKLIFVGQNHGSDYGAHMLAAIEALPDPSQVRITGFAPSALFRDYLTAADLGIQLRQSSRGETSGAVMDAMSHGLPQIANANGSFAELDRKAVMLLPDEFEDAALVQALNQLYQDAEQRKQMSEAARRCVLLQHTPELCAAHYRDVIEAAYQTESLGPQSPKPMEKPGARRLFLDVTATHYSRLKSGIQRVALALCRELMNLEPALGIVTPVYLALEQGQWIYREASDLIGEQLDIPKDLRVELPIDMHAGDTLLILDLTTYHAREASMQGLFEHLHAKGIRRFSIVYDLLPVRLPAVFPPGTDEHHERWLQVISELDGALCISAHVADDLKAWRADHSYDANDYKIDHFMLGADLGTFNKSPGRFKTRQQRPLRQLINRSRHTFLMVGTIEPRKGYLEVLDTFERLWEQGHDIRLVIVGRPGWQDLLHHERRDIPHTIFRFNTHPEKYHRLLWIGNADDRKLEEAYEQADCLIAASYDEGFGLPIIEAARRGIPVIARDIPVFREVAPTGTQFFQRGELDDTVARWQKPTDPPEDPHTITWHQSAQQVLNWLQGIKHKEP